MSRRILIEKIEGTTRVTTYDSNSPLNKKHYNYNSSIDVVFDTANDIIIIDSFGSIGQQSNPRIVFKLDDLEDKFGATNLDELSNAFALNNFFVKAGSTALTTIEIDFKNTTDVTSEPLDGIYNQTVDVVGTGTIANPQYPIGEYKIIDGVITALSSGSGGGSDDQIASEVPFTAVSPRIGRDNTQDAIEKVESNLDEIASSTLMAFSTPLTNATSADPKLPDFNTTTNTFTLFRDTIMHYRNQRFVLPADTSIVMSNNSSTHKIYFNVVTKELFTIPWNALLTASQVVNMQLVAVTRKLGDTATLNITSPYTINRDLSANFDDVILNGVHAGVKGIAHRGASITAPENTVSAYQLASDLGFSWWETDVAFTSDGIPVLMHDDTIDRTSNGSGLVSSMTLTELQAFDYGSWKSPTYAGEQILTFEGLLKLAVKLNSHIFVEPKGIPTATERQTMLDLIKSTGMTGRINMLSFDLGTLQNFRDEDPTLELGFLGGNPNLISRALTLKTPTNIVSVIVAPNVLTQALSDEVHNAGMSIYQYTLNTEAEVVTHADLGGDGVITDIVNVAKALGAKSQGGSRNIDLSLVNIDLISKLDSQEGMSTDIKNWSSERVRQAIQKQSFLRVESINDLKASTITEVGDKIAVKFLAKNNTVEFFNYERVTDIGQIEDAIFLVKGIGGEVYQLSDTDRVTPFMFGAEEKDIATSSNLQEFFDFISTHDYIGDFSGEWYVDTTIIISGIFKKFECGTINSRNNTLQAIVSLETGSSDFYGKFRVIGTTTANYSLFNVINGVEIIKGQGRNFIESIYVIGVKGYGILLNDQIGYSNIFNNFGFIKLLACGSVGSIYPNGSSVMNCTLVENTGSANSIVQKSILTLDSIDNALYKDELIEINGDVHIIEDLDIVNNKLTVYPWVNTAFTGDIYGLNGGLLITNNDSASINIEGIDAIRVGSIKIGGLYGSTINILQSQSCGIGLCIGANKNSNNIGSTINQLYAEGNGFDIVKTTITNTNTSINSIVVDLDKIILIEPKDALFRKILFNKLSTVFKEKGQIYEDVIEKPRNRLGSNNIINISNEKPFNNVTIRKNTVSFRLKWNESINKLFGLEKVNATVLGTSLTNIPSSVTFTLDATDEGNGITVNNGSTAVFTSFKKPPVFIAFYDYLNSNWIVVNTTVSNTSITEVNTSRELNNTDNNSILIVTASSTLTIPAGLVNGFNCAIYTKTGILTNDTVAGITEFPITAGSTLQENRSQVIMQDPTDPTNYIITGDNE